MGSLKNNIRTSVSCCNWGGISAFLFYQLPEFIHLIIFGTTLALSGISLVLIAYQKAREKMESGE